MSTVPFTRQRVLSLPNAPHNLQAETAVLATVFRNNAALGKIAPIVKAEDFFTPNNAGLSWNGRIFLAMVSLAHENSPIDTLSVIDYLKPEVQFQVHIASIDSVENSWAGINVEHYAKVIREKSTQRKFLHKFVAMQEKIQSGELQSTEIATDLELFTKETVATESENKLLAVDVLDFLTMNLKPKEYLIEPILPTRNSAMIFAPTGAGKTFIMLYMAYSVAIGYPTVFVWDIPKQRRVIYVEGEVDGQELQDRQRQIARSFEGVYPERGQLKLIASDLPDQPVPPRINSVEGRKRIEDHLSGDELLILDNLTALCPSADDDESSEWSRIQEWILSLRRRGVGVFLVHHPGKSGTQLGTSKKEFQLNCNIHVKLPNQYDIAEGLRVEVKLDKLRSRGSGEFKPQWAQPFEISLRTEADGYREDGSPVKKAIFTHRPLRELLRQRAIEMLQAGMRENDVAQETGLDRFTIYRLKKKLNNGDSSPA